MNGTDEMTISLKDLLYRILLRWRLILVCLLLGAVLFGGVGYRKNRKAADRPLETAPLTRKEQIEKLESELPDNEIAAAQAAIKTYLDYQESRVLVWISQGLCFLVPGILWIFLMRYCAKMSRMAGRRAERIDKIEKRIWRSLLYLLLAGGILLLIKMVRIPEDMIPAKWSDFDFWTEYGKRLGAACQVLIRSEKRIPDIPMMKEFAGALQWTAAAVAGEVVFLRKV